jgi:hypothetical protein
MDSWSISKKGKVNGTPILIGDALLVENMGFSQRDSLLEWERISVVSTGGLGRSFPAA